MRQGSHETEIKLPAPNRREASRKLTAAGFRVVKRRVFEANTVFDMPDLRLRNGSELLRLREAGGTATVTYKGAPEVSQYKHREEIEIEVSEAGRTRTILERLGYRAMFRYEKYRTELEAGAGGTATIDETPIGVYVELEGGPRWIDRSAKALGFGPKDYILSSYWRLYSEWCERQGEKPSNMVFQRRRR